MILFTLAIVSLALTVAVVTLVREVRLRRAVQTICRHLLFARRKKPDA